jgi:hypothetical protein
MAISSGTHAVGTLAAFNALSPAEQALYTNRYDTFTLFAADIAVGGLTGDMNAVQISDITENAMVNFTAGTAGLNNFIMTIKSNNPHNGNPLSGHKWNINHNGPSCLLDPGNGSFVLEDLYLKRLVAAGGNAWDIEVSAYPIGFTHNVRLNRLLIDGNDLSIGYLSYNTLVGGLSDGVYIVSNCKMWGVKPFGTTSGIEDDGGCGSQIENCTIVGSGSAFNAGYGLSIVRRLLGLGWDYLSQPVIRNTVVYGFNQDFKSWSGVNKPLEDAIAQNCASGDTSLSTETWGTGTGNNHDSITPSQEFASQTDTDPNFLFLKDGTISPDFSADKLSGRASLKVQFTPSLAMQDGTVILGQHGTTPQYASQDISGFDRPGDDNLFSIGCHEEQFVLI